MSKESLRLERLKNERIKRFNNVVVVDHIDHVDIANKTNWPDLLRKPMETTPPRYRGKYLGKRAQVIRVHTADGEMATATILVDNTEEVTMATCYLAVNDKPKHKAGQKGKRV